MKAGDKVKFTEAWCDRPRLERDRELRRSKRGKIVRFNYLDEPVVCWLGNIRPQVCRKASIEPDTEDNETLFKQFTR